MEENVTGAIFLGENKTESPDVEIQIVKSWNEREIEDLYRAGGWWREEWDQAELSTLMRGSYAFAVAIERATGHAVGMGRVISDGISDAYLQDVVVSPAFRNHSIGCRIVEELVSSCLQRGISWIGCIATPNSAGFYHDLGFREMRGFTPLLYKGKGNDCTL